MARKIRIVSGIILFLFLTGHLINQAMGLHSLKLMEEWHPFFMAPWSNPIGAPLLMLSLISHGLMAFHSLYRRGTLNMSTADSLQYASGFLIFPLLIPHVIGLKLGAELIPGYQASYQGLLHYFWVQNPLEGLRQVFVVVVVWVHGAIGLLTYFRLQSWWSRLGPIINPLIVLIPVCALLGFVESGKEIILASPNQPPFIPSAELLQSLQTINTTKWTVISVYLAMLAITLIARHFRLRKHLKNFQIRYLHGPSIKGKPGASLLEQAIENDVPHANLCRGRGRCGTCQVRIISSDSDLPAPSAIEQATLDKIGATPDIRLACQLVPFEGALVVERLLPPDITPADLADLRNGTTPTSQAPTSQVEA